MQGCEDFWRQAGGMSMPPSPFGPQYVPQGMDVNEDVDRSRQDTGSGWDQAYTMEREPPGTGSQSLLALQAPPGIQISRDATYLNLERNTGNSSEEMSPLLRGEILRDRFNGYVDLIEWAPSPGFVVAHGYTAPVRDDVLPTIAKMMPEFDYAVIDTQELLNDAVKRTRMALYGR